MNLSDEVELFCVMPCLNEGVTVASCVRKALTAMQQHGIRGEVIVADNGSTDQSRELAGQAGARVVLVETRGYGSALRAGISAARGRFVLIGDADDSYDFSHLDRFVEKLREGSDFVIGNRFPRRHSSGRDAAASPVSWHSCSHGDHALIFPQSDR